jgi:hypothetical protein
MMNQVILTLTDNDGNSAILDLYENEKMHLNYKFTDITDFASVGNYSQEFRVPASKTNTDFFGAIFNVNFDGWFDFRKKVDAVLTVNTIPIASGHIQVKKLYWQSGKLFEFEVVFFGEVPNLARLLNEKKLKDIESIVAGDLDYDLLHANVETPPNEHTILTLCDKWNLTATNVEGQPVYSSTIGGQPTYKPLYVGHLTPAVKAQYLFDQIMSDAGLQYQSDYLGEILENVYVPFVNGQYLSGENGMNNITSSVGLASNVNNITATASNNTISLYTNYTEYEDQGNNWSSGIYTVPYSAEYTFRVWINGQATRNNTNTDLSNTILTVFFELNGSGAIALEQINFISQTGTPTSTTIAADFLRTLTLQEGDVMRIKCSLSPIPIGTGAEASIDIDFYGNANVDYSGTGVELVSVSTQLYGNQPVYMEFNAPDMKQIDFITSIQKMFNLVFVADKTLPNTLRIEPMVEYIASGNTLDWSQKLDLSKDIMYSPTTDLQKAKFSFTYASDSDFFNSVYTDNGRTYGRYEVTESDFEVINEFATGEEKVELAFASTPSAPVENTDVVVPKFLNAEGQFVQPKPRILYYFADFFVNMFDEVSGDVVQTAVKCLNNYSTMNATVSDSDLNFAPEVPIHTIVANPYNNLYNRWWRNYYRELFDGQARILEGMFALTLNDVFSFQFSDKIWIVDSWWRVLEIQGYVVGEQDMTKVKLIRVLDIDNDCDLIPVSANLDQSLNWENPNGDPATITQDCCLRFGYNWNSAKNNCYSQPNNGTRSFITQQVPSLAPTKFGAPVSFGGSISQPVRTITTDYVVTNFDRMIFADTTSNGITIYLPSATTTAGRELIIQRVVSGANPLTIQAYTGETVEGSGSVTLSVAGDTITIISNGSDFKGTSSK